MGTEVAYFETLPKGNMVLLYDCEPTPKGHTRWSSNTSTISAVQSSMGSPPKKLKLDQGNTRESSVSSSARQPSSLRNQCMIPDSLEPEEKTKGFSLTNDFLKVAASHKLVQAARSLCDIMEDDQTKIQGWAFEAN